MPLINLSVKHGTSLDDARGRLETAVREVQGRFGGMVWGVVWNTARDRVRIDGAGFQVEMWVDDLEVHATGDLPLLGGLLSGPLTSGLKQILRHTFPKKLP